MSIVLDHELLSAAFKAAKSTRTSPALSRGCVCTIGTHFLVDRKPNLGIRMPICATDKTIKVAEPRRKMKCSNESVKSNERHVETGPKALSLHVGMTIYEAIRC